MKRIIALMGAIALVGCESKPTAPAPVSKPTPPPPTMASEPIKLDYGPPRTPPAVPKFEPLPPIPTLAEPTEPPALPMEYDHAVTVARLRGRVFDAQATLKRQDDLIVHINRLESEYVQQWNPNGNITGAEVTAHVLEIQQYRAKLLAKRDELRKYLSDLQSMLDKATNVAKP